MQKKFEIAERNVVITGGASGIGLAFARALGKLGCKILIAEPGEEKLKSAVASLKDQGINARYQLCDVSKLNQVEELADAAWESFGRVDMVFNNAGIGFPQSPLIETEMDELHAIFDVNFFGVWHGCRVFGRRFIEQGSSAGKIET
ncbi:MAG: SDR family NAD(P)-dependent oxidoreductase [Verrucomicrobiota bacterium]